MKNPHITGEIRRADRSSKALRLFLKEVAAFEPMSAQEEYEVFLKIRNQDDRSAKEKIFNHNMRFVVAVAKLYYTSSKEVEHYYELSDLINEGNIALWEAIDQHDITLGFKFISYATKSIFGAVYSFIGETRLIRIPGNKLQKIKALSTEIEKLMQQECREIYLDEILEESSLQDISAEGIIKAYTRMQTGAIERTDSVVSSNAYLEFSRSDDEVLDTRFIGFIWSQDASDQPDYGLMKESLSINIQRVFNSLYTREADILSLFFGINQKVSITLSEIAKRFNLSKKRIHDIKNRAIRKMRYDYRRRVLYDDFGIIPCKKNQ